jgi:hypothetical protein
MSLFRVTLSGSTFGQLNQNVWHFVKEDDIATDRNDLAFFFKTRLVDNPLKLNADQHAKYTNIHVIRVGVSEAPYDLGIVESGFQGPSNNSSAFECAVLQLKTAVGGRRGRGRIYLWGWGAANKQSGLWDDAVSTRLQATANQIKNAWILDAASPSVVAGFRMVVASRNQGETGTIHTVTDIIGRRLIGCQRRRNLGVGA